VDDDRRERHYYGHAERQPNSYVLRCGDHPVIHRRLMTLRTCSIHVVLTVGREFVDLGMIDR
jgi:hypothetical protein